MHNCERCHECSDSDASVCDIEGPKTVDSDAYIDEINDTTFRKDTAEQVSKRTTENESTAYSAPCGLDTNSKIPSHKHD
jgi:hypothetical protein